MKQVTVSALNTIEKRSQMIFIVLLAAIVAFSGLYVYFVINTIANTATRLHTERNIAALSSSIGDKESSYISEKENITMNLATTLGFVPADTNTTFVTRATAGKDVAIR